MRVLNFILLFAVAGLEASLASSPSPSGVAFCGLRLANEAPGNVHAFIAGASFGAQESFRFPVVAGLSIFPGGSSERDPFSNAAQIQDGLESTPNGARLIGLNVADFNLGLPPTTTVRDVAVLGVPLKSGPQSAAVPQSVTAVLDSDRQIRLFFPPDSLPHQALLAGAIQVAPPHPLSLRLPPLPAPSVNQLIVSVSLATKDTGELQVFAATERQIFRLTLNLSALRVQDMAGVWETFTTNSPLRIKVVRALSSRAVVIASDTCEVVLMHQVGLAANPLNRVPLSLPGQHLLSLSAYGYSENLKYLYAAAVVKNGEAHPVVMLWNGKAFAPLSLRFPNHEIPMAVSYSGIDLSSGLASWRSYARQREFSEGALADPLLRRHRVDHLLLVTRGLRQGTWQYRVRAVTGQASGELLVSTVPSYHLGHNEFGFEEELWKAGFNLDNVRRKSGESTPGHGSVWPEIRRRLLIVHEFQALNEVPDRMDFKGDANGLANAWLRRVNARRDTRVIRSGLLLTDNDVTAARNLLNYELMVMEDLERLEVSESPPSEDAASPPVAENEHQLWKDRFKNRMEGANSILPRSLDRVLADLRKFRGDVLNITPWEELEAWTYATLKPRTLQPLFLLSRHYFVGRPFKAVVLDFLAYCESRGGETLQADYLSALLSYLQARDPLRPVFNDDDLRHFLGFQ